MNFIKAELDNEAVAINFNPWLFNDQKQLVKSFFGSIANAIGKRLSTNNEKIAKVFEDYADSIGSLIDLFIHYGIGPILKLGKILSSRLKKTSVEDLKK